MNAQGLLMKARDGRDLLLTTEPRTGMNTYRLAVMQKVDGRWKHANGIEDSIARESMIGAFVDFFVDICRVLSSSNVAGLQKSRRGRQAVASRARGGQPLRAKQER